MSVQTRPSKIADQRQPVQYLSARKVGKRDHVTVIISDACGNHHLIRFRL